MENEKNHSLVDIVTEKLIDYIKDQDIAPGTRIPNEYELCDILGVGRSTVREAIRRLVSRNILTVRQGSGTFVSQKMGVPEDPLGLTFIGHNSSLALNLSDVRILLEPAATACAALNATQEQIEEMVSLCEQIRELADSGKSYTEQDMKLHCLIGESCGNEILRNIIRIMMEASAISIRITRNRHRDVAYSEHRTIVQAIQRRDANGARYAMLAHLNTAREDIAQLLEHEKQQDASQSDD